jgi:hypothetical protein
VRYYTESITIDRKPLTNRFPRLPASIVMLFFIGETKITTKEIADIAGLSSKTVTRTAKARGIGTIKPGVETTFTENESVFLMSELRKRGFIQPRQNVPQVRQNDYVTKSDLAEFGKSLVSEMFKQMLPLIQGTQKQVYQIEAPQIDLRSQLRQVMNTAARSSGDYAGAWNMLYNEIYYRLHINAKERAKNADCKPLDILEAENQLSNAVLIAREIFK